MTNVKDFVKTWNGKKELYDLPPLDLATLEIYTKEFEKDGKKIPYQCLTIGGYDYSLKTGVLSQIKTIIETRPLATKIQFKKAPNGDIIVFDL